MLTSRNRSRLLLLAAAASTAAMMVWLARLAARPTVILAFQSPLSPVPTTTATSTTLALTDTVIEVVLAVVVLAAILFVWRRATSRRTQ